ncbi:MAG: flagellar hook capping FlgD N-terminal domain-containing protein [Hydrogenophaga sp.]
MFTSPIDVSNLGTTAGSTTATNSNNATDPEASQDRFLKLLVAQINNQDPLNPMDNAQMTSQMAQINTVSGIQELNATLKGMAEQMSATQSLQGASLIGREALIDGNELSFEGNLAKGALTLPSAASRVYVDIMGRNGEIIDTVDMGAQSAGQRGFEWNSGSINPNTVGGFAVRASQGAEVIAATPLSRIKVASVGMSNGVMNLQLANGRSVPYDQARAFM